MDDDLPDYARNLQELQRRSGRTQAENARRAGLERDAYGRYLHGKTRPPAPKLAALARAFEVAPSAIDPERPEVTLEDAELPRPWHFSEGRSGEPGMIHLHLDAELPLGVAQRVAEIVAEHARYRSPRVDF